MKLARILAAGLVAGALAMPVAAQMTVEDQIETRKATYQFISWNMGKIKAQTVDGSVPFDARQMMAAANAIAAAANSGMSALYSPESAMDKAENTRLKPEFFTQPEKAREVGVNFVMEANKLQEVAVTGDQKALAQQFARVGQTCKACHDDFRAK